MSTINNNSIVTSQDNKIVNKRQTKKTRIQNVGTEGQGRSVKL